MEKHVLPHVPFILEVNLDASPVICYLLSILKRPKVEFGNGKILSLFLRMNFKIEIYNDRLTAVVKTKAQTQVAVCTPAV
jgi:hypothetical protein